MRILSADVGGTHTRFGIAEWLNKSLYWVETNSYPSKDLATFYDGLKKFMVGQGRVDLACIGVAGPIVSQNASMTNLPWNIKHDEVAKILSIDDAWLINDLEAIAYGVEFLTDAAVKTVYSGKIELKGNRAVIAPGTGLGQATLFWSGTRHWPFATEGGHSDFAPADELQVRLLEFLRSEMEHVSWERVLSGPGIVNIYRFLQQHHTVKSELIREVADPAAAIVQGALNGLDETCREAVEIFLDCLAGEAGNLALKSLAWDGIYVGGGIITKILPKLESARFMHTFINKGRMSGVMSNVPVRIILSEDIGLKGAVSCAIYRYLEAQEKRKNAYEGLVWSGGIGG